jgi:hypothetical protein
MLDSHSLPRYTAVNLQGYLKRGVKKLPKCLKPRGAWAFLSFLASFYLRLSRRQTRLPARFPELSRTPRKRESVLVTGFFDVYNIFNTNAGQAVATNSGSSFLRPLGDYAAARCALGSEVPILDREERILCTPRIDR